MKSLTFALFASIYIISCSQSISDPSGIPLSREPEFLDCSGENQLIFEERRARLLEQIGDGAVILSAFTEDSDNRHESRTNNYFHYLSGYPEYNSVLILSGGDDPGYMLLTQPGNINHTIWTGKLPEAADIKSLYGPDTVISIYEYKSSINRFQWRWIMGYFDWCPRR